MKKFINLAAVLAFAGAALLFTGCAKDYSSEINDLNSKVCALSDAVTALQTQISSGAVITNVTSTANGVKVTLSNGNSFEVTNGQNGKDGAAGKDGKAGSVVTIGNDGYWYIDGVKQSLKAEGKDGVDGNTWKPDAENDCWVEYGPDGKATGKTIAPLFPEGTITAIWADGVLILNGVEGAEGGIVTIALDELVYRVQSLKYIPEYSDGQIRGQYFTIHHDDSLDTDIFAIRAQYQVSPVGSAVDAEDCNLFFAEVKAVSTAKAKKDTAAAKINKFEYNKEKGIITIYATVPGVKAGKKIAAALEINTTANGANPAGTAIISDYVVANFSSEAADLESYIKFVNFNVAEPRVATRNDVNFEIPFNKPDTKVVLFDGIEARYELGGKFYTDEETAAWFGIDPKYTALTYKTSADSSIADHSSLGKNYSKVFVVDPIAKKEVAVSLKSAEIAEDNVDAYICDALYVYRNEAKTGKYIVAKYTILPAMFNVTITPSGVDSLKTWSYKVWDKVFNNGKGGVTRVDQKYTVTDLEGKAVPVKIGWLIQNSNCDSVVVFKDGKKYAKATGSAWISFAESKSTLGNFANVTFSNFDAQTKDLFVGGEYSFVTYLKTNQNNVYVITYAPQEIGARPADVKNIVLDTLALNINDNTGKLELVKTDTMKILASEAIWGTEGIAGFKDFDEFFEVFSFNVNEGKCIANTDSVIVNDAKKSYAATIRDKSVRMDLNKISKLGDILHFGADLTTAWGTKYSFNFVGTVIDPKVKLTYSALAVDGDVNVYGKLTKSRSGNYTYTYGKTELQNLFYYQGGLPNQNYTYDIDAEPWLFNALGWSNFGKASVPTIPTASGEIDFEREKVSQDTVAVAAKVNGFDILLDSLTFFIHHIDPVASFDQREDTTVVRRDKTADFKGDVMLWSRVEASVYEDVKTIFDRDAIWQSAPTLADAVKAFRGNNPNPYKLALTFSTPKYYQNEKEVPGTGIFTLKDGVLHYEIVKGTALDYPITAVIPATLKVDGGRFVEKTNVVVIFKED